MLPYYEMAQRDILNYIYEESLVSLSVYFIGNDLFARGALKIFSSVLVFSIFSTVHRYVCR